MESATQFSNVTAVVLAGGLGTRLRSVVADRPKVLAEICARPFLSFILDQLREVGVQRAVLCTGYMSQQVEQTFGASYGELQLDYSVESQPLGTGGAVRLAASRVATEELLVVNGDSFCPVDLYRFYRWHQEQRSRASLLAVEVPDTSRYGRLELDAAGRVIRFEEKGAARGSGWINGGWYLIERRLVNTISDARAVSLEREAFPAWIENGLYAFRCQLPLLDIGTPESFAAAESFFAELQQGN
jgi:D-glycero-alpha-D-manno-heptose 1-phosphate guanylyltransferase